MVFIIRDLMKKQSQMGIAGYLLLYPLVVWAATCRTSSPS